MYVINIMYQIITEKRNKTDVVYEYDSAGKIVVNTILVRIVLRNTVFEKKMQNYDEGSR